MSLVDLLPEKSFTKSLRVRLVWLLTSGLALFFFVLAGYWASDYRYADQLLEAHQLKTVDDVFAYVTLTKRPVDEDAPFCPGRSFRRLVNEPTGQLWCDEGAIVIAVMSQRLGLETRLVDMIHKKTGISGHTIVEVKTGQQWQAYDFTEKKLVAEPCDTVDYPCSPQRRTYPSMAHYALLNNSILREVVQSWKSRHWSGVCQ
jgi:hypothetical protein